MKICRDSLCKLLSLDLGTKKFQSACQLCHHLHYYHYCNYPQCLNSLFSYAIIFTTTVIVITLNVLTACLFLVNPLCSDSPRYPEKLDFCICITTKKNPAWHGLPWPFLQIDQMQTLASPLAPTLWLSFSWPLLAVYKGTDLASICFSNSRCPEQTSMGDSYSHSESRVRTMPLP